MRLARLSLVAALVLSASPRALAEDGPRGALTLEDAVSLALARAPELRASALGEAAARARGNEARSAWYPRATVDASYVLHWPKSELDLSRLQQAVPAGVPIKFPSFDIDDVHHFQAGLTLQYPLFDLARGERIDAATEELRAAEARTAEAASQLAFQVRATFLAALFARDVVQIATESLDVARREEARARRRVDVGAGNQVALAQSRVRRAGLEAQLHRAENDLRRQGEQLASLVGRDEVPVVTGDLAVLAATVAVSRQALAENPVLVRLAAERRGALHGKAVRSLGIVPTLGLFGRALLTYPRAMKLELGPVVEGGASLSWLLFDGLYREATVDEAEAQAARAEAARRATEEGLERKLIELDARARTASSDLTSAKATLEESEVYLRVARAAVEAGTGTDLDVHTAELGLDQARIAVRQALLSRAMVEAERLLAYGRTGASPLELRRAGKVEE